MTIALDGTDVFELANGGRATMTVKSGSHTISGRLGVWPFKVSGEISFDLEPGQHINIVANPAGGTWGHKLVFERSGFEGEITFG
jgi:hypothetical protein